MYDRTKEALMMKAILAFAQGCGGAEVSEEACQWFHDRYSPWIGTTHKIGGRKPMEVWDEEGNNFLDEFRKIGERVAARGGVIDAAALEEIALDVEEKAPCPYCPIKGE